MTDTTVTLPETPYKAGHYCNKCGQYGSPTAQHTRPNSDQLCNYLAVQAPRFIDSDMHAYAAAVSAADNAALREINAALCAKSNSYIVWNARLEERVKVLEDALRRCEASTTNDAVGQQARAALGQKTCSG